MKMTKCICRCGKEFEVEPSRLRHGRGKHCSPACQYQAKREAPRDLVHFVCRGCGIQFSRPPATVRSTKGAGKFCTRACRDKHWRGRLNPNFQDGLRVSPKGSDWQKIKRAIIRRDKVCQECGVEGQLHVHHIVPFRCFEGRASANNPDNLVALCPPCHRMIEAQYKWIKIRNVPGVLALPSTIWDLAKERGCTGIGFKAPKVKKRARLEDLPLFAGLSK